ncbi:hypothetical protein AVEN_10122-1 [Araneus ventricosus]|uniref:Uncharacterized protein n=1 Tax=Araneus ventricosus TaxID=182803 RepID=A0A4Y2HEC4_ARAVE|nr:hypothetical protein AVEN_10122-1 [Araneus ventricosus]
MKSSLLVSEQRAFRKNYGTFKLGILHWFHLFQDISYFSKRRPSVLKDVVDTIRDCFACIPQNSTYRGNHELNAPQPTVWKISHHRLRLKLYYSYYDK